MNPDLEDRTLDELRDLLARASRGERPWRDHFHELEAAVRDRATRNALDTVARNPRR